MVLRLRPPAVCTVYWAHQSPFLHLWGEVPSPLPRFFATVYSSPFISSLGSTLKASASLRMVTSRAGLWPSSSLFMVSKATPLLCAKARKESALSTLSSLSLCPFTSKLIRIHLLYAYYILTSIAKCVRILTSELARKGG